MLSAPQRVAHVIFDTSSSIDEPSAELPILALIDLNLDTFEKGFRDGYEGNDSALTQEQMQEVLMTYQKEQEAKFVKDMESKATDNKAAGEAFLAANAKKEGVKETASGLQYKVITPGTGKSPKATDVVEVNYEGK